jgi:hypothetical protein
LPLLTLRLAAFALTSADKVTVNSSLMMLVENFGVIVSCKLGVSVHVVVVLRRAQAGLLFVLSEVDVSVVPKSAAPNEEVTTWMGTL